MTVAALSVAAIVLIAACGGDDDSGGGGDPRQGVTADTVTFGILGDLSGVNSATSIPIFAGFRARIDRANEDGGVNGRTIEIEQVDTEYDPAKAVSGFTQLVRQTPVLTMAGPTGTLEIDAIRERVARGDLSIMAPLSYREGLPFSENYFAVTPPYPNQLDVALTYIKEEVGKPKPKIGLLALQSGGGQQVDELIGERADDFGFEYGGAEYIEFGATTADAQIGGLENKGFDGFIVQGTEATHTTYLKSIARFDIDVPLVSVNYLSASVYNSISEDYGANLKFMSAYTPPTEDVPGAEQLLADAKASGNKAEDMYFVNGYVQAEAMLAALEAAGDTPTRESYREALQGLSDLDTGDLSATFSLSADKHQAIELARPTGFDYGADALVPVGGYDDFADALTRQFGQGTPGESIE